MLLASISLQRKITVLVLLFLLFGHMMLFSATGILGAQQYGSEFYFVLRQAACAGVGLLAMWLLSRIRYQFWKKTAYLVIWAQIFMVALAAFSHLGHSAQGATRWLRIGSIQFQPSEFAKIALSFYVARVMESSFQTAKTRKEWIRAFLPCIFLLLVVFRQPDLGTTVQLACLTVALLFVSGMKILYLGGALGIGGCLVTLAMVLSDYRRRRLLAFLNPWADPQGNGFQTIQSFLSFHSGKWFGVGIGNGNSKLFFLPEVHTDFIFSLIGEELGFVGVAGLLILFTYFGFLLFKASSKAPDDFGRLVGVGLSTSLLLQIMVNLGGVTGLFPVKGLPLPFISWGRSALLANLMMIGILLNIVRQASAPSPQGPARKVVIP